MELQIEKLERKLARRDLLQNSPTKARGFGSGQQGVVPAMGVGLEPACLPGVE